MLRERGVVGAAVDDVMRGAGLTHGGFYAHFKNKDHLIELAIGRAFAHSREALFEGKANEEGDAWLDAATKRYVSMDHVNEPGRGCTVPAAGAELVRGAPNVRDALGRELSGVIDRCAERLGGPNARERAMGVLATWIGSVLLARAVNDAATATEVLAAGAKAARAVGATDAAGAKRPAKRGAR